MQIENHTYNTIKKQAKQVLSANRTTNDKKIQKEFAYYILEKATALVSEKEQAELLQDILDLKKEEEFLQFDDKLKAFVRPFPNIEEQKAKQLFKKIKKLHFPKASFPTRATYISWFDNANNRKFMITERDGKLAGLAGTFITNHKKSICHLCRQETEVGLFTIKGKVNAKTYGYKAMGHYICTDSVACNENLTDRANIDEFFAFLDRN